MKNEIRGFRNNFDFLSNFYASPLTINIDGKLIKFPDAEHAFQFLKTEDPDWRQEILNAETPGKAKRLGRKCPLRPGWEDKKIAVMRWVLVAKFSDPLLKEKLLATKDSYLEETNTHNDDFWGVCTPKGLNVLGILLMEVRDEIQRKELDLGKNSC